VLVEVGRLPHGERHRKPKKLWLWWNDPGEPDLAFSGKPAFGTVIRNMPSGSSNKPPVGCTIPRLRHPSQSDRWSWLIVAAYLQLRPARACVADLRLPWEWRYIPGKLSPCRMRRVVLALFLNLGTPARLPRPCGRSPGCPKGYLSRRVQGYRPSRRAPEPTENDSLQRFAMNSYVVARLL